MARVRDAARSVGLHIEVRRFAAGTRTAQDAADAIGCPLAAIVKSLVFRVDDSVALALVSGASRLDEAKLATAAAAASCMRATPAEVRAATGVAVGAVPPLGLAGPLATYMDPELLAHPLVWASAGSPQHMFAVPPRDLARAAGAQLHDLART